MLTDRYSQAFAYAAELHRDQLRKGTAIPYLSHLMAVSVIVLEQGGSEDQAIAALLHDAVEDQGGLPVAVEIRRRFGEDVARIVLDCTDAHEQPKPAWRARKEAYLASLPKKRPDSLLVSLADKTHNAECILRDVTQDGPSVWGRFKTEREGTLWYYDGLASRFAAVMPGPLAERLRSVAKLMAAA